MKKYIKPVLKKKEKNTFVYDVVKTHVKHSLSCRQCSSCHGCRG